MARLIVKRSNSVFAELELQPGESYFVGRDTTCDIVLDHKKGISRRHLKITDESGQWSVELLSRMDNLIFDGQAVQDVSLIENTIFEVEPFQFEFVLEVESAEQTQTGKALTTKHNQLSTQQSGPNQPTAIHPVPVMGMPLSDSDSTIRGEDLKQFIVHLTILGTEKGNDEILELNGKGPTWMAGRDPQCEIHIDDGHCSRNHFELARVGDVFYIQDLGSANGTSLNGVPLKPKKKEKVLSGDTIEIQDITVHFEARDPNFEQAIEQAEQQAPG